MSFMTVDVVQKLEAMATLYAAGNPPEEIAASMGVHPATVRSLISLLRKNGVAVKRKPTRPKWSDERKAEMSRRMKVLWTPERRAMMSRALRVVA